MSSGILSNLVRRSTSHKKNKNILRSSSCTGQLDTYVLSTLHILNSISRLWMSSGILSNLVRRSTSHKKNKNILRLAHCSQWECQKSADGCRPRLSSPIVVIWLHWQPRYLSSPLFSIVCSLYVHTLPVSGSWNFVKRAHTFVVIENVLKHLQFNRKIHVEFFSQDSSAHFKNWVIGRYQRV